MFENVPKTLKNYNQWVCWVAGKIPVQPNGTPASSTDPATWSDFETALSGMKKADIQGIGFVFTEDDPFIGIDFDGCRNPDTGEFSEWAKTTVTKLGSYSELSPSQTGCKVIVKATPIFESGRKIDVEAPQVAPKRPGIEIYHSGRYFTITGKRLAGTELDVLDGTAGLAEIKSRFCKPEPITKTAKVEWTNPAQVIERARMYVQKMEPAIAGARGHDKTFAVACVLVIGFGLTEPEAFSLLREYNARCDPPWNEKELAHKIRSAAKQPGERNYLRNAQKSEWDSIMLPTYSSEPSGNGVAVQISELTLEDVAFAVVKDMKRTGVRYVETGLPELDYSLGGGLEPGELVVIAARPSHGKSAVGLQMIHHSVANQMPCLMISEEMSEQAVGKRIISFVTDVPKESWEYNTETIQQDLETHFEKRAKCYLATGCSTIERAISQIEHHVETNSVQLVVVDYAQILTGKGKSKYDQVSNVSVQLAKASKRLNVIVVMLCQLNREIENRNKFKPTTADLRDSGQIEQDADVIVFLVWPHRKNSEIDPYKFEMHIAKNRNREIKQGMIECRFLPSRQMICEEPRTTWQP